MQHINLTAMVEDKTENAFIIISHNGQCVIKWSKKYKCFLWQDLLGHKDMKYMIPRLGTTSPFRYVCGPIRASNNCQSTRGYPSMDNDNSKINIIKTLYQQYSTNENRYEKHNKFKNLFISSIDYK